MVTLHEKIGEYTSFKEFHLWCWDETNIVWGLLTLQNNGF